MAKRKPKAGRAEVFVPLSGDPLLVEWGFWVLLEWFLTGKRPDKDLRKGHWARVTRGTEHDGSPPPPPAFIDAAGLDSLLLGTLATAAMVASVRERATSVDAPPPPSARGTIDADGMFPCPFTVTFDSDDKPREVVVPGVKLGTHGETFDLQNNLARIFRRTKRILGQRVPSGSLLFSGVRRDAFKAMVHAWLALKVGNDPRSSAQEIASHAFLAAQAWDAFPCA